MIETLDVELLGMGVGATNGGVGKRADTRQDEQEISKQMRADAWLFAVLVPAIFELRLGKIFV